MGWPSCAVAASKLTRYHWPAVTEKLGELNRLALAPARKSMHGPKAQVRTEALASGAVRFHQLQPTVPLARLPLGTRLLAPARKDTYPTGAVARAAVSRPAVCHSATV